MRDILHKELRSLMIKLRHSWGNSRKNGIIALTRLYLEYADFNEVAY